MSDTSLPQAAAAGSDEATGSPKRGLDGGAADEVKRRRAQEDERMEPPRAAAAPVDGTAWVGALEDSAAAFTSQERRTELREEEIAKLEEFGCFEVRGCEEKPVNKRLLYTT